MSSFWSAWIIVLTALTIILVVWLLFATRKLKNDRTDNTTGHVYDGIVEEDNPLPSWWFSMFILSVLFGLVYLALYPGLGSYQGLFDWTSASEHDKRVEAMNEAFEESFAEFNELSIDQLATNTNATNMGRRLFANNCAVCHGAQAAGNIGFPNLRDDEWQWGGGVEQIEHSIKFGRTAMMPSWKAVLSAQQLSDLVDFVAKKPAEASVADASSVDSNSILSAGETVFKTYCGACHAMDGTGNPLFGAPSLVDDVWLYGSSTDAITISITEGRNGQMPAHDGLLGDAKIKLIVAYILSLSQG